MGIKCVVSGCSNSQTHPGTASNFHRFPSDPEARKRWADAIGLALDQIKTHTRVCSSHFTQEDYQLRPGASYPMLKSSSVPSVKPTCCVPGCPNVKTPDGPFKFYTFPRPPHPRCAEWLKFVKPDKFIPSDSTVICSAHFSLDQYAGDYLKYDAVPDIEVFTVFAEPITKMEIDTPAPLPPQAPVVHQESVTRKPCPSPTEVLLRKKVKILQQKLRRKEEKIYHLKALVEALRREVECSDKVMDIINNSLPDLPLQMSKTNVKRLKSSKKDSNSLF